MKSDVAKKIDARVVDAFDDIVPGQGTKARQEVLNGVRALVEAVWAQKIYAGLPKDKTKIPDYYLDAELDQMLNDARRRVLQDGLFNRGTSRRGMLARVDGKKTAAERFAG